MGNMVWPMIRTAKFKPRYQFIGSEHNSCHVLEMFGNRYSSTGLRLKSSMGLGRKYYDVDYDVMWIL